MLETIFRHLQTGNPELAETMARALLDSAPDAEEPLLLLAFSLDAQGRSADAMGVFERLTRISPHVATHWINLGVARRDLGLKATALEAFQRARSIDPTDPNALLHMGSLAMDEGSFAAARELLLDALAHDGSDPTIRIQAANACYECGEFDQAEEIVANWRQWAAADALTLNETGWLLTRLGMPEQGGEALHAADELLPDNPRIQMRLAAFYERSNRVVEAEALLYRLDADIVKREGLASDVAIVRAGIVARSEDRELAIRLHEDLLLDPEIIRRDPQLLSQLARLYDDGGDPDAAMRSLARGRKTQLDQLKNRVPKLFEPGADPIHIVRRPVTSDQRSRWPVLPAPQSEQSPVFVVGFPRSGTTMLETMLDAHPALVGMDERVFVQDAVDDFKQQGWIYPDDLEKIDGEFAARLRANYWQRVGTRVSLSPGVRLVDKNPLNIMRLPMISRLFPNAKVILALRHPCDVVLSNYMQTFRSPAYIKLCETIESTAIGYADTFAFWIDQVDVLKPAIMELRYEDVVDDIEAKSRQLADFIGIPWDRRMVDFHDRARERGYIATPSYHQVVEPLNRKGIARWERYREYLRPAIPHLQPYLQRWGYDT